MTPADHDMPVITATRISARVYSAEWPDGRLYRGTQVALTNAASRIGTAIRFVDLDTRSASEVSPLRSPSPAHGRRGSVAADPPFGAGAAPSGGREAGASDQTGSAAER